jgi:hypothetical protein
MTPKAKEILNYLQNNVNKKGWQYFDLTKIMIMFNAPRNELNELAKLGHIAKRRGINGDIVELLNY